MGLSLKLCSVKRFRKQSLVVIFFYQEGWRNNKRFTFVIIFLAMSLFIISVLLSWMLAKHEAMAKETQRLQLISSDVVARMQMTRVQFVEVVQFFSHIAPSQVCHPSQIKTMQELDVGSNFLQAVAHMKGSIIECSSIPGVLDGLDLGSPINIEQDGTRVWTKINIPGWKDRNYVLFEKSGWAVLIVPEHAIEALGNTEASVGIFSIRSPNIFTARGNIYPDWIAQYKFEKPQTFIDSKRKVLVYMAPAEPKRAAVIATLPLKNIDESTKGFAKLMLPIGAFIGLALGGLLILLAKNRYSPKSVLLKALANNEFYMEYQPIIKLSDGTCVGAEALIRWKTSDGNTILPDIFIPIAEATGVIRHITSRVFDLVANDMREVFQQHPDVHIGINISSHDLISDHLVELIEQFKKIAGAKNSQIFIEVTERGFLNDETSSQIMREIREQGVNIAIDDFGTGYSSLAYLTKFEIDYLKIDKAFVDAVGTDAVTGHVAFHIIEMAKSLNLEMVAEGVGTDLQAKLLSEKGVKYVQGWLFSKSLEPDDFHNYLKSHLLNNTNVDVACKNVCALLSNA